ncbi:MAG TPA: bacteriohopanetetrol glucosamine biosynthesis glycosyltransferase HpnI [Bryobacteraceae bacterium]|nr:bacteriohopanetetrol glucosamine biosynthesis glycosyltransferase HpnI [Bryobacteraceae bacterium]
MIQAILLVLVAGSLVYSVLTIFAARDLRKRRAPALASSPSISILKPLRGLDEGLLENLRSYATQAYAGEYEVLFGVDEPADPARAVADQVCREFPDRARVLVTGQGSYTNPKEYSLEQLGLAAQHDLWVLSDSDIRVTPDFLETIAAEFQDERLGLETCPYRGVPGASFWSTLEAIMMNTEFMPGVMVARIVEGMNFAVGPTIIVRRKVMEQIGGFGRVADYYIDDFLLGRYAHENGWKVELSRYVIEHRIGAQRLWPNLRHRIMWLRGTRRSRPSGYFGQVFTYPIPLALLLWAAAPGWWAAVIAAVVLRYTAAFAVTSGVLNDPLTRRLWYLLPLQDVLSFVFYWIAMFGKRIRWRGRSMVLLPDGRLGG